MFCRSTLRRKPNGIASIDWRTVSSARAGVRAERLLQERLGDFQTAAAAARRRASSAANSRITFSCSSDETLRMRAISIETCSTCFGSSLAEQRAGVFLGKTHQQHGGIVDVGHGGLE